MNEMIGYCRSVSSHKEALEASEPAIEAMTSMGRTESPDFGTTLAQRGHRVPRGGRQGAGACPVRRGHGRVPASP
ncbi:MAG: hypothetical protein LBD42_05485 [Desulfovibrio sp.]|nr:hypothetical protein [Desulfovibrio sp.]